MHLRSACCRCVLGLDLELPSWDLRCVLDVAGLVSVQHQAFLCQAQQNLPEWQGAHAHLSARLHDWAQSLLQVNSVRACTAP